MTASGSLAFKSFIPRFEYSIITGDCRSELVKIGRGLVDVIVTSPPYWGIRNYPGLHAIGFESEISDYLDGMRSVFRELLGCLKTDGSMWCVMGDCFTSGNRSYRAVDGKVPARAQSARPRTPPGMKPKDLIGLPWKVAEIAREVGWYIRAEIIWMKPNPLPESVFDRPSRGHETIFLMTRSKKYRFYKDRLREQLRNGNHEVAPSVWRFPVGGDNAQHSAPFPKALSDCCLSASAVAGNVVLDPFCGSGTVGLSALDYECGFIGVDVDAQVVENCTRRIDAFAGRKGVETRARRISE
jgi:site-specific DNA-methyltransferase (cytosine-N4-specific)